MLNIPASIKLWIQAVRAPFFTASVVPVFLALALALWRKDVICWPAFPLMLLSVVFLHAGTNTMNDYCDFKNGVDKKTTFGSSRVLVDGLMRPGQLLTGSLMLFCAGVFFGLILVALRGMPILVMGLIGLAAGFLYSAAPLRLKYIGLGDITVFIFMGPFLVVSAYYALTGIYTPLVLCASFPIGFLVTAILHANNIRDLRHDRAAGIKTLALILGLKRAKLEYYCLLGAAYISVFFMVLRKDLPVFALAVFVSFPLAAKNILSVARLKEDNFGSISLLDISSAKLHMFFGVLFILSLLLAAMFAPV